MLGRQVNSELLLGVQNLQRTVEEVVVGNTNTKVLSKGNAQHSESTDTLIHYTAFTQMV